MDAGSRGGREGIVGHGSLTLLAAFALAGALIAGAVAAATGGQSYRAHAYVIRVPPAYDSARGLAFARSRADPDAGVQLTGRGDFAITVGAGSAAEAMDRATASAKAIKRSLTPRPGLGTIGRGAHAASHDLGPFGWALLGAAAGFWLGAAAAIVRRGSGRAPRRASPPCPPGRPATRG
jgi:hypothetical protein